MRLRANSFAKADSNLLQSPYFEALFGFHGNSSKEPDPDFLQRRHVEGPRGRLPVSIVRDALEYEFMAGNNSSIPVFLLIILRRVPTADIFGTYLQGLVLREQGSSVYSRLGIFDMDSTFAKKRM
jgi:hypothetical protein